MDSFWSALQLSHPYLLAKYGGAGRFDGSVSKIEGVAGLFEMAGSSRLHTILAFECFGDCVSVTPGSPACGVPCGGVFVRAALITFWQASRERLLLSMLGHSYGNGGRVWNWDTHIRKVLHLHHSGVLRLPPPRTSPGCCCLQAREDVHMQ